MAYCDKTGDHSSASLNNEDSRNGHDPATDKPPTPHSKGNANDCCATEEARTVSVPHGLCVKKKKLVLHVDLNNTILVSDAVTGQGTIAALDYFISTVTWGQMSKQGKWMWMSDSPSLLPPCEGAVSYYSQFGRVAGFTSSTAGRRFRGVLDEHLAMLRWPKELKGDKELAVKGEDGQLYHWILPSFFQLLKDLVAEGRDFAILFRTFGSDLPRVLSAVSRALTQGSHPLFPDLPALKLSVNETPGQIRCSKKGAVLTRAEERLSTRDGERALYQYLSSVQCLGGFQDHFDCLVDVVRTLGSLSVGGPGTPTPSWEGNLCGWTPSTKMSSTSSSMTTFDRMTKTPSSIQRCFWTEMAQRPAQPPPQSCMTSVWSRTICSGPSQTQSTSPSASASARRTMTGTFSRGQARVVCL
ncbi:uncharacterized protein si:dkey-32e6.3 isoform X1 [Salmo salar]|uniref:Uncharacterized protein si:dkey-32e6.3 isoform X1 n=1 Tax=Salmo salar TaxID=8030 RepID=A0A1S3MEP0_SALSA|nr:uncharacterized protein si:dkey-32e6.3 isoform X1 [Salmo salar]XP_045552051.1 uncharacterized protein si:dkey-32e6.3 isoform X1 [Salmo salar]